MVPRHPRIAHLWPWLGLAAQASVWFGFAFGYVAARRLAIEHTAAALARGRGVSAVEVGLLGASPERLAEHVARAVPGLFDGLSVVYWLSEFVVTGLVLLWLYREHVDLFTRARNAVLAVNVLALPVFLLLPVAPPWALAGGVQGVSLAADFGDPFAALPSLHVAMALVTAYYGARASGRWVWIGWPFLVTAAVLGTGNHYLVDAVAGAVLGGAVCIVGEQLAEATA